MNTWLPDVELIPGNDAGAMNGVGGRKLLLHSTEGASIEGAVAAYRARNVWPTLTVDMPERRVAQHLALEVAARSLKNLPGGVETNRAGKVLVQIEIVGSAVDPSSLGSPEDLDWFGREVVAPICEAMAIPMVSTVRWVAYPASYGQAAVQRLSPSAWVAYSGLLGHQHAPENDHGDPGAIDIGRILAAATQEVHVMLTNDEVEAIARRCAQYVGGAEELSGTTNLKGVISAVTADLTGTKNRVKALADTLTLDAIAEAAADRVVAKLPAGSVGPEVVELVRAAVREVAAGLTIKVGDGRLELAET